MHLSALPCVPCVLRYSVHFPAPAPPGCSQSIVKVELVKLELVTLWSIELNNAFASHTATYMHEFERPKNVPFSRQIGGRRRQRTVEIENENISSLTIFNWIKLSCMKTCDDCCGNISLTSGGSVLRFRVIWRDSRLRDCVGRGWGRHWRLGILGGLKYIGNISYCTVNYYIYI